jgi:hypothetical protein
MSGAGDEPRHSSRRLTYHPGLDDHAAPSPGGSSVVWSRQVDGRIEVVSAAFMTGHGALLLVDPRPVAATAAPFAAPLAWSPDARGLAVGRGNPFGPLRAEALDPATGRVLDLAGNAAGAASVAWSSDGGRVAVVLARPAGVAAHLPGALGFLLRPWAAVLGDPEPRLRDTELRTGDAGGELAEVELGPAADWGSPTGVALEPDGTRIVLGQRRDGAGGVEERLLRVTLDCTF